MVDAVAVNEKGHASVEWSRGISLRSRVRELNDIHLGFPKAQLMGIKRHNVCCFLANMGISWG